ncbi:MULTISPECIES: CxC ATPase DNA modification system associated small protein [Mesorhizobium]|uniref:DUF768 domain-containing protein n=1 Tax=Mesorhizobium humile TaxID=3072313 RepID=A0ABU4YNZ3_9HYPH|nr:MULTISPECIES: CxC ATPase DNA modification system associated small protein [unclassified Mesorhizobium]MDX8463280.1 hypothetical protein [Mesorhizobium sp. VK2D]MDX8488376.1 hypothetical protein [Mesorhizobium sp. VK2B]
MPLDPALEAALHTSVNAAGQPKTVAQRLVAWLKSLSDGEGSEDQNARFYENVLEAVKVKDTTDED